MARGRTRRTGRRWCRWCRRSARCAGLGDPHVVAVDAVPLQPGAVVGEVLAGGTDQHRARGRDGRGRSTCWPRRRRGGSRGRRPGRRPRTCRAARRPASRRTSRRSSSGGRWRWSRRSAGTGGVRHVGKTTRNTTDGYWAYQSVATSVEDMTAYDDLASARPDARRLPPRRPNLPRAPAALGAAEPADASISLRGLPAASSQARDHDLGGRPAARRTRCSLHLD